MGAARGEHEDVAIGSDRDEVNLGVSTLALDKAVAPISPANADDAARTASTRDLEKPLASVVTRMRRERNYRRCLAVADGSGSLLAILVTAALWGASPRTQFALVPVLAIVISKVLGLYDRDDLVIHKSTVSEWRAILRTQVVTGTAAYIVWHTAVEGARGIRLLVSLILFGFIFTVVLRVLARAVARTISGPERCLIVGTPDRCRLLALRVEQVAGVELLGVVSMSEVDPSVNGIHELADALRAERIIIGPHAAWRESSVAAVIQSAKWLGVRISLTPTLMEVVGATTAVDELDSTILLGVPTFGLSRSSELIKRSLDLLLGTLLLIPAIPVMAIITCLIRLDSPGPAVFCQRRIGRHGRPFTIYKFRSMVIDAEQMRDQLAASNESAGLFKVASDPRVTRVGAVIRKTYLDELPQLFNVLRGDMSLVGPRPLIESEDALLTGHDRHRSRLTPGMTGPWQLRGPIDAPLSELAKLDYLYASDWSIWKDVDILLGTAGRVLGRGGH